MRNTLIAAFILTFTASSPAAVYLFAQQGGVGTNLSAAPPGTPFSLDFRPKVPSLSAPYTMAQQVGFIFDGFSTSFLQLKIDLDSSDTIFSFDSWPGNQRQLAYVLYDPALVTPGPGMPTTPDYVLLPQAWRDELTDGVLSGKLWITGASNTPGNFIFSANTSFEAPEPSAGIALVAAAALTLRRQRTSRRAQA